MRRLRWRNEWWLVFAAIMFALLFVLQATAHAADQTPIKLGAKGQRVLEAEYLLRSFGYSVTVDRLFDARTDRAVRHFQRSSGLTVDGVAGPLTMAALIAATATRPAVRVAPPDPPTVEQIIRQVWPDDLETEALRIARRESNLQPGVRNYCCFGLFQIYWTVHRGWLAGIGVVTAEQLFDPRTNTEAAWALYQRAGGWGPWAL